MSEESKSTVKPERSVIRRLGTNLLAILRTLVYLLGIAWASGAVYYDAPLPAESGVDRTFLAGGYALVVFLTLLALGSRLRRFLGWIAAIALVAVPWSLKKPVRQADWEPAWSRMPSASTTGDLVTFHNFRNFDYDLQGGVTERWETRVADLSKLEGLDLAHHVLKQDLLAHPLLCFDFGDQGQVAFSVEVRYRKGQEFSPLRGLYKQYNLIYLAGDERDFLRERATVRKESVRLYRSTYPLERVREMFRETVAAMNTINETPQFYHTLTANCSTSYIKQAPPGKRPRFDHRIILNGLMESLLYEREVIATDGLPLEDLVRRATINEAAREAHKDPAFSARIREGRPGF